MGFPLAGATCPCMIAFALISRPGQGPATLSRSGRQSRHGQGRRGKARRYEGAGPAGASMALRAGMTREQLAEKSTVGVRTIRRMETGTGKSSLLAAVRLLAAAPDRPRPGSSRSAPGRC
ncbi:helix-turn-helix domain-containing protein [Streptomyces sp. UNOB3_S3]|uniref:helix-turn-helix domain-containing protein n=1 Tax=Streptomyces sp. UNOB3_S3 TaxID=2871682 RepID=UPI0035B03A71